MLAETNNLPRSLVRSWPQLFTTRRQFSRQAENQTYLEWLNNRFGDGNDDGDEDETSELSSKDEDDDMEVCTNVMAGSREETKVRPQNSIVRRFMEGMVGEKDLLLYRDQVDVVSYFCEQAGFKKGETRSPSEDRKVVALLDERNNSGNLSMACGASRPYLGPLTSEQLRDALSRKVIIPILPSCKLPENSHCAAFPG